MENPSRILDFGNFTFPSSILAKETSLTLVLANEARQPDVQQPEARLAKVKVNSNFTAPCNTSILYPTDGGNMHCFTAVTACAVLDVLGPPYSDSDGRHCQFYFDFPFSNISVDGLSLPEGGKEGYAWLQERKKPEDLIVVGELYGDPTTVET